MVEENIFKLLAKGDDGELTNWNDCRAQDSKVREFFNLISKGDFEKIKKPPYLNLLLEAKNDSGETALHVITRLHNGRQTDLSFLYKDGRKSPAAYCKEKLDFISFLLENKADVNIKDSVGRTPIMHATDKEIVNCFLKSNADINASTKEGNNALNFAISYGNSELVEHLVSLGATLCETSLPETTTIFTTKPTLLEAARLLVPDHAKAFSNFDRSSERTNILLFIVKKCSKTDVTDQLGQTALHIAAYQDNLLAVARLVDDAKLDIHQKDLQGKTPFLCARSVQMHKLLQQKGADITACDNRGANAFHYLAESRETSSNVEDIIKFLLEEKLDINSCDKNGNTPLMYAKDNAELLLRFGADITLANICGKTAIDILYDENNIYDRYRNFIIIMEKFLIALHKKKSDEQIKNNEKIFELAIKYGDLQLIMRSTQCSKWDLSRVFPKLVTLYLSNELQSSSLYEFHQAVKWFKGKVDFSQLINKQFTVLHVAILKGDSLLVDTLLCEEKENGQKERLLKTETCNYPEKDLSVSPLALAILKNISTEVIERLLAHKPDPNVICSNPKRAAVHFAVNALALKQDAALHILNLLLQIPTLNLDIKDENKQTPLHLAAELKCDEGVKILAVYHAQKKIRAGLTHLDLLGHTILMSAIISGCNTETVRYLVTTQNANLSVPGSDGRTVEKYLTLPTNEKASPNFRDGRTWLSALFTLKTFLEPTPVSDLILQYLDGAEDAKTYNKDAETKPVGPAPTIRT